jgi:hemolysin activation/secretion protein
LHAHDGVLGFHYLFNTADIRSEPVRQLDINSRYMSAGVSYRNPIYRQLERQLLAGALFEWRRSRTFVLGDKPESFTPGTLNHEGVATVSVLRGYLEWSQSGAVDSVVVRSTLSFGLNVLEATENPYPIEDGRFISWLTQAQWIHRLEQPRLEFVVRGALQLTSNPLLPMERFSVGGRYSVRGYRENRLVQDNGWTASAEVRLPLWSRADGTVPLQLATFLDAGRSWWAQDRVVGAQGTYLAGVGFGFRWIPREWLFAEFYWGLPILRAPGVPAEHDAQDDGIYFRVTAVAF